MNTEQVNKIIKHKAQLLSIGTFCLSHIFFTACSSPQLKTADQVNALSQQNKYEQALELYQTLDANEQEKISLEDINEQQRLYLSALFAASERAQKVDYAKAKHLLTQGQTNLPTNEKINAALQKLENDRISHTNRFQNTYNLEFGHFLLTERQLLDKLAISEAGEKSFIRLQQDHQVNSARIAPLLGQHGLALYHQKKRKTALPFLRTAQQLEPQSEWKDALADINQDHSKRRSKQARKAKQEQAKLQKKRAEKRDKAERTMNKLQNQFEKSLSQRQFVQAQNQLKSIKIKDTNKTQQQWITRQEDRLEFATATQLKKDIELGQRHYSSGNIDEAIATWRKAQQYAPDNLQLKEHIDRAETFQARFESLKQ